MLRAFLPKLPKKDIIMKNKRNIFSKSLFATILCAVLMISGCDFFEDKKQQDTQDESLSHTEQTNDQEKPVTISGELLPIGDNRSEPTPYPVTINDTVIEKAPSKVICLSSGLTEMIYELGYGDKLIGRGSYCEYPEDAADLTDFGKPSAPDIAAIEEAAPDLVITATSIANMDVVALNDRGIKVMYISAPRSLEEYGRIYEALGMIFEGMFDGETKGNTAYSAVRNKLDGAGISFGKFIYVTEGLAIAGGDTFESSVLSLYGTNIAADASGYNFDKSLLSDDQPDTVIISSDISAKELTGDSVLGSLDAVKSGKIYTVNNSYFESPSGRLVGILDDIAGGAGE